MRIQIASDIERDDLFAELYSDDELWAEVSQKTGRVLVFLRDDGTPWRFTVKDMLNVLTDAIARLELKEI